LLSSGAQDDGAGPSAEPKLQLTGRKSGCAAACGRVGGVVIANLYRVLLLAIIITLVVLVSINVRPGMIDLNLIPTTILCLLFVLQSALPVSTTK